MSKKDTKVKVTVASPKQWCEVKPVECSCNNSANCPKTKTK